MSALSLEACGFAERGEGYKLGQNARRSVADRVIESSLEVGFVFGAF
jgi:hypothetical protein